MSDTTAIRAYVEKVVADYLGTENLIVDGDGDIPIQRGSAVYYVRVTDGPQPLAQVFSIVLDNVEKSAELLDTVNEINAHIDFARVYWASTGRVMAVIDLLAETLDPAEIANACSVLGSIADHYDDQLQALFGGSVAVDQSARARVESAVMQFLGTDELIIDSDGDIPIRRGSALYYVRVTDSERPLAKLFSIVLDNVDKSTDLLDALNDINMNIRFARIFWVNNRVMASIDLLANTLDQAELANACETLSFIADHYDDQLQERFGGSVAFAEEPEAPAVVVEDTTADEAPVEPATSSYSADSYAASSYAPEPAEDAVETPAPSGSTSGEYPQIVFPAGGGAGTIYGSPRTTPES